MQKLRVAGVPEPYNLPWHLAMEAGAFAAAGIDLRWHTVPEGTGRMCQMLRDGELDLAVLVTEGAVRDIRKGGPHHIISTFVESPLPWGVHVPAGSALHVPGDLKGVPFAISRKGSGSHLMALLYARKLGWTPSAEDLIVVDNMEGAARRMGSGEPMVFLWEKFVTSRYVDAGILRKVDEVQGDWPGFVVVARDAAMERQEGAIRSVLSVLKASCQGLRKDDHTVDLVRRNAGFTRELAQAWLAPVHWHVGPVEAGALAALGTALRSMDH